MAARKSETDVVDVVVLRESSPELMAGPESPARLRNAGESTDPLVHHLIAELGTARLNDDEVAVVRLTGRLQALGYSA